VCIYICIYLYVCMCAYVYNYEEDPGLQHIRKHRSKSVDGSPKERVSRSLSPKSEGMHVRIAY
jgi:hypothetical protein